MVHLDCETYKNYFSVGFYNEEKDKTVIVEMHNGVESKKMRRIIYSAMANNLTVGFNSNGYDLIIITAYLEGYDNLALKKLSDEIILGNAPAWQVAKKHNLVIPQWNHIDLIEVAFGKASLKMYGARLGAPTIQDLPIDPDSEIDADTARIMRKYLVNDLKLTKLLSDALKPEIELRKTIGEQYGLDLRSKSDAQIAETIIKSELTKLTGKRYYKPDDASVPEHFRYIDPEIIRFETYSLQEMFERVLRHKFEVAGNGSVKLPDFLKQPIIIGGNKYQMGIGGLHSCEKSQYIEATDNTLLCDLDVASYYPSIILQQRLAPESLGEPFLKVYQSIVERRLKAKREGDSVTAGTLKIAVNGSFGKLGSKWSALYAPELLIQTTLTGQLALLMLIERMEFAGISVVSANTDGIVCHLNKSQNEDLENAAFDWMLDTSYTLERTDYRAIASRDVNNYVAVKLDGSYKGKGAYAKPSMAKNPEFPIVHSAVALFIAKGVEVWETIMDCTDIKQFLCARRVTGGAVYMGEEVGKVVRFYLSTSAPDECIEYKKNGNKVPQSLGAKPLMTLPETLPDDIDYKAYLAMANEKIRLLGYEKV